MALKLVKWIEAAGELRESEGDGALANKLRLPVCE